MNKQRGRVYLFFAFTLAGTSVISVKILSGRIGTFTIAAVSLLLAQLFLFPVSGRKMIKHIHGLSAKRFLLIVLQAVFGIFLFRMFLISGLLHTSAVEAGILTGATPAITAVLAAAFLKETVNRIKISGILCTVVGVFLIQGILNSETGFAAVHLGGNLLVLCAAVSESIFNILSRSAVVVTGMDEKEPVHPLVQTTLVTAVALLLCMIPACLENPLHRLSAIGIGGWLALVWYGLFVTALAFVLWYAGISHCEAFTAAAFSGMMPLTAMLLGVGLLGEQAGWQQWSGGLLVIAGMVLIGIGKISVKNTGYTRGFTKKGEDDKR